jgi:hypothetical protein
LACEFKTYESGDETLAGEELSGFQFLINDSLPAGIDARAMLTPAGRNKELANIE